MEFEPGISEQDIECVIQVVVSMREIPAFNLNSNFPIPEFTVLAPERRTLHTGYLIFWSVHVQTYVVTGSLAEGNHDL
ncbi:hypothetical protein KQX54_003713 [Cotesia glomerata]|uniref:Uncharacterized protein n=1 Tax=Cotesia glomerata TaxID=32391 RepID=A0AAV7ICP0_COTGL|nr:hypothetical protein KQX54_003713 [Cotesia glomerata]